MKYKNRKWLVLIFLLFPGMMLAQKADDKACQIIQKAVNYHCQKKYNKSLNTFQQFRKNYPAHELSEEAYYAMGMIYFEKGKYEKAKEIFNEIVSWKDYKKYDSTFRIWMCVEMKQKCDHFIRQEDLLTIQHESCIQLAEIGFKTKNYPLVYLSVENADKYYRVWNGCGTGDLQESIRLSLLYSRYYQATGLADTAIQVLLPTILEPAALPINYYKEAVNELVVLMKKRYTQPEINKLLNESIENLICDINKPNPNKEVHVYFINLLGVKIHVAPGYLFAANKDKEEVKNYIRNTDFYIRLVIL